MKILLTGGAGFIGFHVAQALIERGDEVVIVDNLSDYYDVQLKKDRLASLSEKIKFYQINLADYPALKKVFQENQFDKICHLGAQAGVRYSLENPFLYEQSNSLGTLNILELMKEFNLKDLVFASSSSVYGGNKKIPFSVEDRVDQPLSLYAATKRHNEHLAYVYHHLYGFNCWGLRFFTCYGPFGRPDMALFKFTKAILEDQPIEVYNFGNHQRDFTYISDIVAGVLKALDKVQGYELLNLGNNCPVELNHFISCLEKELGKKAQKKFLPLQKGDVPATFADIEKTKQLLNWEPKVKIEEGIKEFVKWYKDYYRPKKTEEAETKICVVGLGYVGLPLAMEFSQHFPVLGFDVKEERINQLKQGLDPSGEVEAENLKNSSIIFTPHPQALKEANFIIVCVPTPVDKVKRPDLRFLESASEIIGKNLTQGAIIVYESTVYPGCTEEICVPVLEKFSGLKSGVDFKVGYSPERINPGDKEHTLDKIVKIVAGMDEESLEKIAFVYGKICKAGLHKAPNIKTAEAAKVIENIQRDLNIALMNELALIFNKLGISTREVLEAAGTKWNFHKYQPGLVGGHCIPEDPYYLTHKAVELGYHPEIILAGRRLNDNMYKYVVDLILRQLNQAGKILKNSRLVLAGLTFKENVKDFRNSKAQELIEELKSYGITVFGYDPLLGKELVSQVFNVEPKEPEDWKGIDGLVLLSPHHSFRTLDLRKVKEKMNPHPFIFDLKNFLDEKEVSQLGFSYLTV